MLCVRILRAASRNMPDDGSTLAGCLVVLPTSWTRSISTEKTAANAASCLSGWSPLGYILHITGYRQSIHHNFSVGIYAKSFRKNRRLFWFDQIALFPKTIALRHSSTNRTFFQARLRPLYFSGVVGGL